RGRNLFGFIGDSHARAVAPGGNHMFERLGGGTQVSGPVIDDGNGLSHKALRTVIPCALSSLLEEGFLGMKIGFYRWSDTDDATKARILRRSAAEIDDVMDKVLPIIADVKARGDAA